ncbi:GIY-YIG nuclease family protein [Microbacterium aquilitoris]|uniref:GIY-YIG nuclease family protein n=1 Tax=Microbacterium aquilitoris TaxID=3067307 RepID=A0ABU3GG29_9MICO|nr:MULTISPECIES: GIY-YIG nuclease family protein [unclassified Microbacterium]MDT3329295.1 GIY-YIG nuclease family protein [Microbacterium sp. KSW-18]MDT3345145.1 GIY-YIG nuclease family protein [Microbacterium sp. KSW2-22]
MPASLPRPCRVCGGVTGDRLDDAWYCDRCGWRLGDAPDADLPRPRVDVVYYLRFRDRVKIGTSATPRRRLAAIMHDELLAFEPGDRHVEHQRHVEFADLREGGEWFTLTGDLATHIADVRSRIGEPWAAYDRWLGDAYRRLSS